MSSSQTVDLSARNKEIVEDGKGWIKYFYIHFGATQIDGEDQATATFPDYLIFRPLFVGLLWVVVVVVVVVLQTHANLTI